MVKSEDTVCDEVVSKNGKDDGSMIAKLEDTKKAARLFDDWQESILYACLQKTMGAIYADDLEHPKSAMAMLGDFCFFAGDPEEELVRFKPETCKQDFMIMVPQDEAWAALIAQSYGSKAKVVTRYAIKKEADVFDRVRLQSMVDSLKPEYELRNIDRTVFELCAASEWSRDLISQFEDYESFRSLGLGVVILKDGELVSGASTYARYLEGIEIEIDTKETCRRKGLALVCGAKLILECLDAGLYPSWDAHNKGSAALAEKLGYHVDREYLVYEIRGY